MTGFDILLALLGLGLGGFLKGATGAGTPVVGVPVLALILDVPTAVAIFSILNLLTNLWQSWSYRAHAGSARFIYGFALAGGAGAVAGSFLLANLPTDVLMGSLGVIVFFYVALRLARPGWALARDRGEAMAPVAGVLGGLMQGAGGISAPISVTYLNAMRLPRPEFIATISVFFTAMSVFQVPTLWALGVITPNILLLALASLIPLFAAMPLGEFAAKRISKEVFDRVILALLVVIGLRLLWVALPI